MDVDRPYSAMGKGGDRGTHARCLTIPRFLHFHFTNGRGRNKGGGRRRLSGNDRESDDRLSLHVQRVQRRVQRITGGNGTSGPCRRGPHHVVVKEQRFAPLRDFVIAMSVLFLFEVFCRFLRYFIFFWVPTTSVAMGDHTRGAGGHDKGKSKRGLRR